MISFKNDDSHLRAFAPAVLRACALLAAVLWLAGCSSSHQAAKNAPAGRLTAPSENASENRDTAPPGADRAHAVEAPRVITWKPHFIATGSASGIMVEFTGMKSDKPVNAKFATIEIQSVEGTAVQTAAKSVTASINALRQAFFELPPGHYIIRQTKAWAAQEPIRSVEVKEGHYSLIPIVLVNPKSGKQLSERYGE